LANAPGIARAARPLTQKKSPYRKDTGVPELLLPRCANGVESDWRGASWFPDCSIRHTARRLTVTMDAGYSEQWRRTTALIPCDLTHAEPVSGAATHA
jgi:hypothetical protein